MCWLCEALGAAARADRGFSVSGASAVAALLPIEVAALLGSAEPGWNTGNDAPQTVTFSFAEDSLSAPYGTPLAPGEWAPLDEPQRASARQALGEWAANSGLRFLEVADTVGGAGVDIRFNLADLPGNVLGLAAYPRWGEVWLDLPNFRASSLAPGSFGFEVLLHEIGHALGFKHPFEGSAVLPAAQDNTLNTVMSYTSVGGPQTGVGPYDVAVARYVYGTRESGDAVAVHWSFDPVGAAIHITGSEGPDAVRGPDYPRTVIALGGGDDEVLAGSGRDWIAPGAGRASVNAGDGVDTLETPGARLLSSLVFTTTGNAAVEGGGTVPSHAGSLNGGGASISFTAVENFSFLDGRLVFDPADPLAQAARLFVAALGRAPDPDGLNFQAAALEHGASLAAVARGFAASPEYAARFASPDDGGFVRLLYANALGRQGSEAEIAFHAARLAAGTPREQVLAEFSESPENRVRTAAPLLTGLWDQDEDTASVARLYRAVLDRTPDEAGLRFHAFTLDRGVPLSLVAEDFAASPEFDAHFGAPDRSGFVRLLYRNTLGREPDPTEVAFHVGRLDGGTRTGDVLLGFSESPEFHARTMAGIEGGIAFA